ncbi:MAG TPA: cytidylate kinase-like family protein, partial [Pirellulales bacterium]|nr:cytidylate kinase-like family protein [Pirellulales bacterium]
MKTSSELMGEAFERSLNRWRHAKINGNLTLPSARQPAHWTIAISRETGAGGGEVARALGAKLGWDVFDRTIVDWVAKQSGIRQELLETLDENPPHWLIECLNAFAGGSQVTGSSYARDLGEVLLAMAAHGECVIVGRGASLLLPRATTLRVRVIASLADRVQRIAGKRGIDS